MALPAEITGVKHILVEMMSQEGTARRIVAAVEKKEAKETLVQLALHGPVWAGDLLSKYGRDKLVDAKLVEHCEVDGSQGYFRLTNAGMQSFIDLYPECTTFEQAVSKYMDDQGKDRDDETVRNAL